MKNKNLLMTAVAIFVFSTFTIAQVPRCYGWLLNIIIKGYLLSSESFLLLLLRIISNSPIPAIIILLVYPSPSQISILNSSPK